MSTKNIQGISETDMTSARLFNKWMRDNNVTLEQLANETGVGRTTLAALSTTGVGVERRVQDGKSTGRARIQTRWSAIRRPTLEAIHAAVQRRSPMTLREFGKMLKVSIDDRPEVWAETGAWESARAGAVTVMGLSLKVEWDYRAPDAPHVVQGPDGGLAVVAEVPAGWLRLGRLVSITPV